MANGGMGQLHGDLAIHVGGLLGVSFAIVSLTARYSSVGPPGSRFLLDHHRWSGVADHLCALVVGARVPFIACGMLTMDGYARFNAQVPRSLLQRFHAACESREDAASHVVREFMRRYVAEWEEDIRRGQTDPELIQRIATLEARLRRADIKLDAGSQ